MPVLRVLRAEWSRHYRARRSLDDEWTIYHTGRRAGHAFRSKRVKGGNIEEEDLHRRRRLVGGFAGRVHRNVVGGGGTAAGSVQEAERKLQRQERGSAAEVRRVARGLAEEARLLSNSA
jgi:hypothetical protein